MKFKADFSEKTPNTLIIVGNGFDVANNFKTKYSDFYQSHFFSNLYANSNLAKFITNQNRLLNWSDLEMLLAKYSNYLVDKYNSLIPESVNIQFEQEFLDLRFALYEYICSVQVKSISNPQLEKLLSNWLSNLVVSKSVAYILCFNYNFVDYLFFSKYSSSQKLFIGGNPNQVHGISSLKQGYSTNNCPIVLGVDKKNIECEQHKFLIKEFDKNTNISGYFESVEYANKIIIFGCSLGETDYRYFKPLFSQTGKTFEIFCYGDKELINIKYAIDKYVDFTEFERHNNVIFFDSSKNDYPKF